MKDEFYLADPAAVRAISSPVRLRVLALLANEALPAREIAARLRASVHGMYYHLKALQKAGVVKVVRTQHKGNLAERWYQAVAPRIRVAPALFDKKSASTTAIPRTVRAILDATGEEVELMAGRGALASRDVLQALNKVRISRARAAAFGKRLRSLVDEFEAMGSERGDVEAMLTVVYATGRAADKAR